MGDGADSATAQGSATREGEDPYGLDRAHQGIFTPRLTFIFDRVPLGHPIRMTLISRTSTPPARVRSIFSNPVCRYDERAPWVFDARMPTDRLGELAEAAYLFRRIDLSGVVFGLQVPTPEARCRVALTLEEPLSGDQRIELRNYGVLISRESFGVVSGETTGKALCELAMVEWIGSIEVKRVSLDRF